MIDNPVQVQRLFARLEAALPVPARMTPELMATLRKQEPALEISPACAIAAVHYTGDEGGILCKLELIPAIKNVIYVSITHLRFDPRQPLARDIIAYQKHRVKHLGRPPS